jgi:hypothetical protein
MSLLEICPLTGDPCYKRICKCNKENMKQPSCIQMIDFLKKELTVSTIKQYLDPKNQKQYQDDYVHTTRIVQEIYDFTLDEFLILLVRVGENFNAREAVKTYLGSQGLELPHKTS